MLSLMEINEGNQSNVSIVINIMMFFTWNSDLTEAFKIRSHE